MAGAVHERVAPARVGDDVATGPRRRRGRRRRRRTAATPARCAAPTTSSIALLRRRRLTDDDRAGHVGAVAVDERAEVDDDEVAVGDAPGAPGGRWGLAPFGPEATIVSNDGAVRAEPAHLGVELERELAPRSGRRSSSGRTAASASSAIAAAASMRATSPSSFT